MNYNFTLRRNIDVERWAVSGTVSKAAKRPELIPILLHARDLPTNAKAIARHLLFEERSREVVAHRLLKIAEAYGLLEHDSQDYALTERGEEAIATQSVFVPEDGAWSIWLTDDPLLGPSVMKVEEWREPGAYDEVRGDDKELDRRFRKLPKLFSYVSNVVLDPLAGSQRLQISNLEDTGEPLDPDSAIHLVWSVGVNLKVTGKVDGTEVEREVQLPEQTSEEIWYELLHGVGLRQLWSETRQALSVRFEDTSSEERESLKRTLRFPNPEISNVGGFDALDVTGVDLFPESVTDAKEWATWRLHQRVTDYATTQKMAEWTREAVHPFSLENPQLPDRTELAHTAWLNRGQRPSAKTWLLIAAEDWSL